MVMDLLSSLARLSDRELLVQLKSIVQSEREATAALVAHLSELDQRCLHLAEGCSSLFTYCTYVLHFSEHAAYGHVEAARTARKFPVLLDLLASGAVSLPAVGLLAPHLTPENHRGLLDAARWRSKRQVEELVARIRPQPPVPPSIRRLPVPRTAPAVPVVGAENARPPDIGAIAPPPPPSSSAPPAVVPPALGPPAPHRPVVSPLAPERYKVQFTATAAMYEKLRRAQDLLRHQIPDGDPAAVLDRALTVLLQHLARSKWAATDRPREGHAPAAGSRHIPAAVRRAVWERDGGSCAFVGQNGRRCGERGFVEFHHASPHGDGGEATTDNIELRCRAHNQYEAAMYFGPPDAPGPGVPEVRETAVPFGR
jgi:hypothetical protein